MTPRPMTLPKLDPLDDLLAALKFAITNLRARGEHDIAAPLAEKLTAANAYRLADQRITADALEKLAAEGYAPCAACEYWHKEADMREGDFDQKLYCGCEGDQR